MILIERSSYNVKDTSDLIAPFDQGDLMWRIYDTTPQTNLYPYVYIHFHLLVLNFLNPRSAVNTS
jgi:hypothetical protein